ncbi:hypothetical protein ACNKHN_23580 [Shigella flexneri]
MTEIRRNLLPSAQSHSAALFHGRFFCTLIFYRFGNGAGGEQLVDNPDEQARRGPTAARR